MTLRAPHTSRLFGLDLAGIVSGALQSAGGLTEIALLKRTPREVETALPAHGSRSITTRIEGRGTFEAADSGGRAGGKVLLLGASLVTAGARVAPEEGDAIEVAGVAYEIAGPIEGDPAGASWSFAVAGPGRTR